LANSLQEQLLKAGLVDEKRANKAKKAKQRKEKEQRHKKHKVEDESSRLARQAKARDTQRDRELNRKMAEETRQKELAAQVRQLIEANRMETEDGDIAYHFTDAGKVRTLYVTDKLQGQLGRGTLVIAKLAGSYQLVPAEIAEKIAQRDPASVIQQHNQKTEEDEDDPYAEFKVPDDLMW
jgi:uncharacterized protein YaiL (DUF2058 family)